MKPMNDYMIRKASANDADILTKMEQACFSDPWSLDYFVNLLNNPAVCFIIAEEDDTPVGYAGITVIYDECEILNVAVMPTQRRKGIGRILMDSIICICRNFNVNSVFLEHRESNAAAAALYDDFGFDIYALRKNYYSSPTEDAILRKLTL